MNNKTLALILIILVVVVGGFIAWYLLQNDESATNTNNANAVSTVVNRERPPEKTIWIIDGNFSPSVITINVGDMVTWQNQDENLHRISSMATTDANAGSIFRSEELAAEDSFTFTFDTAGTWSYYDELNPIKSGQIIVE